MKTDYFFTKVESHQDIEGLGIDLETQTILVKHIPTGLVTSIPKESVEKLPWNTMEEIIAGVREPNVLHHMTRIVGYYSRVENWNRSKLGELKDRIRGTYGVESESTTNTKERLSVVADIQGQS